MPLPLPPNLGGFQQGSQGGIMQGAPGALPYKQSTLGGITQGVGAFMQNYNATREADEKKALDKAMQGLQLLQQGLPVDTKDIAKNFQRAGVKLQTEGPTPEQIADQQQKQAASSMLLSGATMSGPMASALGGAAMSVMGTPPPQGPPQAPQGMMGRVVQGLGLKQPSIAQNAPIMQSLQQIGDMGQKQMQYKAALMTMTQGALMGDEKAQELLRANGVLPKLDKYEYLYKFGKQMGKTPEEVSTMIWQTEMAPYTNVLLDYEARMAVANNQMKMQSWNEVLDLAKQYPFVPIADLQGVVAAKYAGPEGREAYYKGMQQLAKMPRADALEELRKEKKDVREEKELGLSARRTATGEVNAQISASKLQLDKMQFDFTRQESVRRLAEKAFDDVANVLSNKQLRSELDQGSLNALTKKLVDEYNGRRPEGMPALTVEEINSWWWPWGTPEVQVRVPRTGLGSSTTSGGGIGQFVGQPPAAQQPTPQPVNPTADPYGHMW